MYHYHCQPDINECEQNTDGCEHHCTNFDGGYNCTCGSRYALATDLHNCLGKLLRDRYSSVMSSAGTLNSRHVKEEMAAMLTVLSSALEKFNVAAHLCRLI